MYSETSSYAFHSVLSQLTAFLSIYIAGLIQLFLLRWGNFFPMPLFRNSNVPVYCSSLYVNDYCCVLRLHQVLQICFLFPNNTFGFYYRNKFAINNWILALIIMGKFRGSGPMVAISLGYHFRSPYIRYNALNRFPATF